MYIPLLPRYLLKISLPFFALSLMVFSAVLFMNHFIQLLNVALLNGASPLWLVKSFLYLSPSVIGLALPMAFLLGLLLTLGGLSEQGEIIALRASGYSFRQILWPLALTSVIVTLLLVFLNNWLSPACLNRFKDAKWVVTQTVTKIHIEPRTFIKIGDWKIYSEDADEAKGTLSGVRLFRYPKAGGTTESGWILRVNAPDGKFSVVRGRGLKMELKNGEFQQADAQDPRKLIHANFSGYRVFIPFAGPQGIREPAMQELTTAGLMRKLRSASLDPQHRREYKVEVSSRFSIAVIPLVFFCVGTPLGLVLEKKSRVWGMVLSLMITFAYYGSLVSCISLGRRFEAVSLWVPWLPDLLGLLAGAFFWRRNLYSK